MNKQLHDSILRELHYYEGKQSTIFVKKQKNLLIAMLNDMDESNLIIEELKVKLADMQALYKGALLDILLLRYHLVETYNDDLYEFDGSLTKKYGKLPTKNK